MWHYLLMVPKYLLELAPFQTSIPSPQHTNTREMQAFIFRSILPIFGCYKHFTKEWKFKNGVITRWICIYLVKDVELHCSVKWDVEQNCAVLNHSVVSDSLWPHELWPIRLLCPWGFSRQEYWIFPTQGLNPGLLHCRQILYHLSHQGSKIIYHLKPLKNMHMAGFIHL